MEAVAATVCVSFCVALSLMLQGCDVVVPVGRAAAAWEEKPDYFADYQYQPFKGDMSVLGSCSLPSLPARERCSGHGECQAWNASAVAQKLYFCLCYRDWADPECRTRRKSQRTAYFLALFGGILGLDQFYLGEYLLGIVKLSTVGGLGVWWLADVVRIGSAPVYAADFRLAEDLNHTVFMVCTIGVAVVLGYLFFGVYGAYAVRRQRRQALLAKAEDDFFAGKAATVDWLPPTDDGIEKAAEHLLLKPVGLGDYSSCGKSNHVPDWPSVIGGPYRNSEFYWNSLGLTPKV